MINIKKIIYIVALSIVTCSCESYLDKAPDSTLDKKDVFQDFEHAQGFIEQCYGYVVNYAANIEWNLGGFLLGDETLPSRETYKLDWDFEQGNFTSLLWGNANYLHKNSYDITSEQSKNRASIWDGWDAIRIANIAIGTLEDENLQANITPDEKKLLLGEAYFFRAFFHSEIMKFWGRIPYVDKVLTGNDGDYKIPRPDTYKECALKADADYAKAAELVPEDWKDLEGKIESNTIKETTYANSRRLINKAIVYSFKGRNLLLAASPLMHCTDNNMPRDSYSYDQDLAEKAAADLAKVIDMAQRHVLSLGLADKAHLLYCFTTQPWAKSFFAGTPEGMGIQNQSEYIFSSTAQVPWCTTQLFTASFMPYGGSNQITPNQKFVHNVFGTKNGLSCDEDPEHSFQNEFEDRDPRFYSNLIIDGDQIIQNSAAANKFKYAQCYSDGILRGEGVSKYSSGYFIKKWSLITANSNKLGNNAVDNKDGNGLWLNMRLTDVYLMYAEALAATSKYGPDGHPDFGGITYSALDVLNIFRDRFNMIHVEDSYKKIGIDVKTDTKKFMDVLRRERSTEMCFEACRWTDIRRWLIADTEQCTEKTILKFDRDVYSNDKAKRGQFKNINFKEEHSIKRVCEYPKHFWLPFRQNEVSMYEGFPQNPGW